MLVHAPWDVLAKCAEEMMIRVPVREPDSQTRLKSSKKSKWLQKAKNVLNIFQLQDRSAMKTERQVTAFFSRAKSDCFLIEDQETFFSDIDRSRMTHRLLLSTKYSSEMDDFGISRLLHKGAYTYAYPLHEDLRTESEDNLPANERQRLCQNWASFSQWYKY